MSHRADGGMLKTFAAVAVVLSVACTAYAQADNYQRQSQCGNDARAFLAAQKKHDDEPDTWLTPEANKKIRDSARYDYQSNYSGGGCYILVREVTEDIINKYLHTTLRYRVFEVNTHHILGTFIKDNTGDPNWKNVLAQSGGVDGVCDFQGKTCNSKEEWWEKARNFVPTERDF
jgi:hypothetical protein